MTDPREAFAAPFNAEYASNNGVAFVVDAKGNPVPPEWIADHLNAALSPTVARESDAGWVAKAAEEIAEFATKDTAFDLTDECKAEIAAIILSAAPVRATPVADTEWVRLADEFEKLADEATQGDVAVRPDQFDDWGYVRRVGNARDIVCIARAGHGVEEEEYNEHRAAKTDPYGHNAAFIAWCFNNRTTLLSALRAAPRDAGWAAGTEAAIKALNEEYEKAKREKPLLSGNAEIDMALDSAMAAIEEFAIELRRRLGSLTPPAPGAAPETRGELVEKVARAIERELEETDAPLPERDKVIRAARAALDAAGR